MKYSSSIDATTATSFGPSAVQKSSLNFEDRFRVTHTKQLNSRFCDLKF